MFFTVFLQLVYRHCQQMNTKHYKTTYILRVMILAALAMIFSNNAMAQRYAGFMDDFRNATTDSLMTVDGVRYYMLYVDYDDIHYISLLSELGDRYTIGPAVPADTLFRDGIVYAKLGCEMLARPLNELQHDSLFVENEYPELFERSEATSPCNFKACDTNNFGCTLLVDYPTQEGPAWDAMRRWIVNYVDSFINMDDIYFDDVYMQTNVDDSSMPMSVMKRNNPAAFQLPDISVGQEVVDHYRDVYMRQVYYLKNEDFGFPLCYLRAFITPRYVSDRYVTLFVSTLLFAYGAHDFPGERYITFDMKTGEVVTNETFFKPSALKQVKAKLEEYMECEGRYIGKNEMPQVALMEDGVVFSFQPYQIGSYADGLFHFVVPYDEVKRYIKKN